MAKWAVGWGLLGWCVLCVAGCHKPEASQAPSQPAPVQTLDVVELPELALPTTEATQAEPPQERLAREADVETPPSRLLETDSGSWERPGSQAARPTLEDEDRAGFLEAAEAARAGNASISPTEPAEKVTIATGTVDGRVKRVRPGTIEVSDDEGNIYELRIDHRSRGLRQGRHVPLGNITEGTPVRASFDLVGGGESLARDIQLRR